MPELPEVEVTRRGIAPHLEGSVIEDARLSSKPLRWPAPSDLASRVRGRRVLRVDRRGKYLLIETDNGWLIVHLGMSGSLRVVTPATPLGPWDHFELYARKGDEPTCVLRLTDPRRFGAVVWHARGDGPLERHKLLATLGVEPFAPEFDGAYLAERLRGRRVAIKQALLAGDAVVGVGNIYASEALFRAGIRPQTAAGRLSLARYERLADAIRQTLAEAIEKGGSSLRDFVGSDGQPGYFQLETFVYGRAESPCRICGTPIRAIRQAQRTTYWCAHCQR
ncbi:MAG TPA: bifunctional DNA-formamidopyrimidine glycosylase/DNA-(apurinic or apyrimidinic site) lyase [Burkholderiaceae bacterium]|nr:bifunctional DNA-formamidopyrimidine glycosylase/DNA-(apurinic or apyrimidinic site) lyase [Burkholderiaceae bacterium]